MKLRNKKTGEIGELHYEPDKEYHFTVATEDPADMMIFKTLAELNAEWEDYEEPSKTIWQIKDSGELQDFEEDVFSDGYIASSKSIGNYFDTREEAEKAVEKLKAWKRLKDKGFRFNGGDDACISYTIDPVKWEDRLYNDFDLLFGGEE